MSIGDYCQRPAVSTGRDETVRAAAQRMKQEGVGCLVIAADGHPVAIATDRDLAIETLSHRLDPDSVTVGELATRSVVAIEASTPVREAIRQIHRHGVRRLPVVDAEKKLIGIATADDLVSLLAAELSGLAVAIRAQAHRADSDSPPAPAPGAVTGRYQKEVATIADRDSVRSAAEAMKARAVGSLVVLHDGTAVGIVTDRDLLVRVVAEGRNAATTTAADVMSHPLQVACPEDPLDRVIETMSARGFRRVPVLDDGALVGIVALDDVLGELADELHDLVTGMRRELALAQRVARARELARDAVDRVGELGEQLEELGVEAKNRLFRELDGLRERIRGRER